MTPQIDQNRPDARRRLSARLRRGPATPQGGPKDPTTQMAGFHRFALWLEPLVEQQLAIALGQVVDIAGWHEAKGGMHLDRDSVRLLGRGEDARTRRHLADPREQGTGHAPSAEVLPHADERDEGALEPVGPIGEHADDLVVGLGDQEMMALDMGANERPGTLGPDHLRRQLHDGAEISGLRMPDLHASSVPPHLRRAFWGLDCPQERSSLSSITPVNRGVWGV